jgi:hypothetical protein
MGKETVVPHSTLRGEKAETVAPSLCELNPLLHNFDVKKPTLTAAMRETSNILLERFGGLKPEFFNYKSVHNRFKTYDQLQPRMVVSFRRPNLSEDDVFGTLFTEERCRRFEDSVEETYKQSITRTKTREGSDANEVYYMPTRADERIATHIRGWFIGLDSGDYGPHYKGIYFGADQGTLAFKRNSFGRDISNRCEAILEIREESMNQLEFMNMVVQSGLFLAGKDSLPNGKVMYEAYREMMRLEITPKPGIVLGETERAKAEIIRGLLAPLANPELSRVLGIQKPQSVLIAGPTGTGKTSLVRELMVEDHGVLIVPLEPKELIKDLSMNDEEKVLIPQLKAMERAIGAPVIPHIDDIEQLVQKGMQTESALRNQMAGVSNGGIYIIASTNEPDRIDEGLMEPGRFGIVLHVGIPEGAERRLLDSYVNLFDEDIDAFFHSAEEREITLDALARKVAQWPPRRIEHVATVAKNLLLGKIIEQQGRTHGLTSADVSGHYYTTEDWQEAFDRVSASFDSTEIRNRNKNILNFVEKRHRKQIGLDVQQEKERTIFNQDELTRIQALHRVD